MLRGPQGTLFGAGSEGGTVRYITTPPSLTQSSVYSRDEFSDTQGGAPSYEAGIAAGTPLIDGKLGIRADVWYRHEGGYIDLIDPVSLDTVQHNANSVNSALFRLSAIWAVSDAWRLQPSLYYQSRVANNTDDYWPLYSNPGQDRFVSADPDRREVPDKFYLPSLRITGDFGSSELIANSAYYHRDETSGYEGTDLQPWLLSVHRGIQRAQQRAAVAARWRRIAPAGRRDQLPLSGDRGQRPAEYRGGGTAAVDECRLSAQLDYGPVLQQ